MEYSKLGSSEIEVSRLCVGCMSFGDPANSYSGGTSEEYLVS